MKYINQKWFSLVIAMGLVILMTVMAMVVLEFAVPFSKDIKWIENASNAYYQANSWFEEAMYFISQKPVWSESWKILPSTQTWYSFNIFATWTISPLLLKWNSDFDKDWNKISEWNPIQMEIWSGRINFSSNPKPIAYFRVPDLTWNWGLTLTWSNNIPPSKLNVITWTLTSSNNELLNSSWSEIKADKVCTSAGLKDTTCTSWTDFLLFDNNLYWENLYWTWYTFQNFYDNIGNCKTPGVSCILKIKTINDLRLNNSNNGNTIAPYLEWKINFWSNYVPTRYADINVSGKSYWFKKDLKFSVPQKTVLDTFDFTIFQ